MTISFLDLRSAQLEVKKEIQQAIDSVMSDGIYIGGNEVSCFEHEFADYCEAKYAVGVGNGLDALVLALRALGVGNGDEVIVPANTFIATWLAVSAVGATPVAVEPLEDTYNLDPEGIESAIGERTKAIIAVHLFGQPADLQRIKNIASQRGIFLVEDAAQCVGARYRRQRIGGIGDITCWSFYPGKNLGALGDGGAVTTNDEALASQVRRLGNYGSKVKYEHELLGTNSRLDSIQAAILRVKLKHLDEWNDRRRRVAQFYATEIRNDLIRLPVVPIWADPVWHLYVVKCARRESLQRFLGEKGVQTIIHYPTPPHMQPAYLSGGFRVGGGSLQLTERLSQEILSIPIGPHLSSEEARYVVDALNMFY